MNPRRSNRMLLILSVIMGMLGIVVISNVLFTMITQTHLRSGKNIVSIREPEISNTITLQGKRGAIYDRNGEVIAEDEDTYTLVAYLDSSRVGIGNEPAFVNDIDKTARLLAEQLDMEENDIKVRLTAAKENNQYQTELGDKGKGLSTTVKENIEALALPGLSFTKTVQRLYPNGTFASHLVGFAKYDDETSTMVGQMGLEATLDEYLKGVNGKQVYEKDAKGNELPGTKYTKEYAKNGDNVYLTLDHNVQQTLQDSLATTSSQVNARRAWGIVMEVKTGKILGWASSPSFDLNTKEGLTDYLNVPADYPYEPGSVMKGITYSAAIDSGNYPYNATYESGKFYYVEDNDGKIYRTGPSNAIPIQDAEGLYHGTLSFDKGFIISSNIAICEILANYMDPAIYKEYVEKFGFFNPVAIPFINNAAGTMNFTYASEKLSTGFGQSITVTALQMVQAYSAIFNGGSMMRPYVVDRVVDDTGKVVEQYGPEVVGTPISKETSDYMKQLMQQVVENPEGTGHYRYNMDDVAVIAKTGTGEIAEDGVYGKVFTNSVMAAAPASDPTIMIYYVFESSDYRNFTGDPFKTLMKASLAAESIASDTIPEADNTKESYSEWQEYTMPSLVNHSLTYAKAKLESMKITNITIGNGANVISQSPDEGDTVLTGQKVFLLTDGENITMPNMSGWTKKDITAFWDLTGIQIEMEGTGSTVSQSIAEGTSINRDSEIKVTLK